MFVCSVWSNSAVFQCCGIGSLHDRLWVLNLRNQRMTSSPNLLTARHEYRPLPKCQAGSKEMHQLRKKKHGPAGMRDAHSTASPLNPSDLRYGKLLPASPLGCRGRCGQCSWQGGRPNLNVARHQRTLLENGKILRSPKLIQHYHL